MGARQAIAIFEAMEERERICGDGDDVADDVDGDSNERDEKLSGEGEKALVKAPADAVPTGSMRTAA